MNFGEIKERWSISHQNLDFVSVRDLILGS